jgi:hypothetical protein
LFFVAATAVATSSSSYRLFLFLKILSFTGMNEMSKGSCLERWHESFPIRQICLIVSSY